MINKLVKAWNNDPADFIIGRLERIERNRHWQYLVEGKYFYNVSVIEQSLKYQLERIK